jgi:iron complex transport system substrate-binding protein
MINQKPEVKEKLETLGIPVMTERSSYEIHPLGRTEWIKLYGLLCDKEKQAEDLFNEQLAYINDIPDEDTGKTVAFFYISSAGNAVARKSGDYAVKMIEMAGGSYAFGDIGDSDTATGSVNLETERFYADAKDADIIIYNSSIDGEVRTIDELLAKSHLIADFKAVKNGDVWCTNKNLFQETTEFGLMISDMNRIFTEDLGERDQLNFYYKLR